MMRTIAVCALLIAGIVAGANVKDATDATFDEIIASHEFVMMEFYAPWCGHCKKLEPEYESAAGTLGDSAVLARLDATAEQKSGQKFDIKGFPTIKIFRDGKIAGDYEGGRTAAEIVSWVKSNSGPAVADAATAADVETIKNDRELVFVLFTTDKSSDAYKAFESVAKAHRSSFAFAVSADSANQGKVMALKTFDNKEATLEGEVTAESITAFVQSEGVRVFDEIGPQNYKMYLARKLPMAWYFTPADNKDGKAMMDAVAQQFKGKLSFVWIDSGKYGGMAERLGLTGKSFPAFAIDMEGTHFAFDEKKEITQDGITQFTQDYIDGKIEKTVRSEEAPAEHTVEGLTTIVGSTFDELVANADQDVLIEFYAPWCGHCKKLAPEYQKLAKELADKPVRIAMIDATANDFDQKAFPVQGFPTIMFIPKATRVPQNFEGERTFAGMLEYVKKNSPAVGGSANEDL